MIRRIVTLLIVLGIGGAGVAAYFAYQRHLASQPIQWSGTIEARTMEVGSRVGGRIKQILVKEGDDVVAGQTLIILDPGDLPGQLLAAQAQVAQMEANLDKVATHRGLSARAEEIAADRARLQAEEVALDKANIDQKRTQALIAHGAATQQDLDTVDIGLRNATAQREIQQAQLDQLVRGTPQDVKSAQAQVDGAKGKLEEVQSQIAELEIHAPRPARVEALDLRPGDILAPDAVAARLLEPDQRYVRIFVPETQLGLIHVGQNIPVYVDTFPGRAFGAAVDFISDIGEFTPRNLQTEDERADQVFAARLRIENGQDVLREGMAAFARVAR
jgi:multidrug resistance efflux pump